MARATGMAISAARKGRDEARAGATPANVVKVAPLTRGDPEYWNYVIKPRRPTALTVDSTLGLDRIALT